MKMPTLAEIADQAMKKSGFAVGFTDDVIQETASFVQLSYSSSVKDLRHLPFFSIDNPSSQDLDQLSYAEILPQDTYKAFVAIADVDSYVKRDGAIDSFASINTTSVYTPAKIFTMLPKELSYDLTSLLPDKDRLALVVEIAVKENGEPLLFDLYPAWVRNAVKLDYDSVAAFLENGIKLQIEQTISEQLLLQDRIAQKIKRYRLQGGALELEVSRAVAVVENQQVVAAVKEQSNRARELIENFMIAANLSCYAFLKKSNFPRLCRVVKTPKNWPRIVEIAKEKNFTLPLEPDAFSLNQFLKKQQDEDPDGYPDLSLTVVKLLGRGEYAAVHKDSDVTEHFGLSLKDYTHATAPNRRYTDLIMSRLIKAALGKQASPYSNQELEAIAKNCTDKETAADKVERKLNKCAIARLFINRIGEDFRAMVTGAGEKGTWVRVLAIPIEGKLVKSKSKVAVGDKLSVKLVHVDPLEGFIDFIEI